ncbi:archaea-specific SMC-related protein [Haloarchaeobius sp. DFWS5]|uniref:archaea-specific SMC-related protein n=1 Tax=Haloarchaeobius sp. DFWS5 TaxID=3446114 RepID=UPI003EB9EE1B
MSAQETVERVTVRASNVGGIDETTVEFSPGVTVLAGRNATNRTSFLQALMAGLGSDRASLKADAESGRVDLTLAGETYTRELTRTDDGVVTGGEPYLDDPTLADLYAFLLESNEARRAVARGDDLHELIMRPVDTAAIRAEVTRLEARKRQLDEQLDERDDLERTLDRLDSRLETLADELDTEREALAAVEADIDETDVSLSASGDEAAELEAALDELRDARARLEDIRYEQETEHESLNALRARQGELEAEREELADEPGTGLDDLAGRVDRLHERKREVNSTVTRLQTVVQFNREQLDESSSGVFESLADDGAKADGSGGVTDALVDDTADRLVCWTCGNEATTTAIRETVDLLTDLREEKLAERREVDENIDELEARLAERRDRRDRRETVVNELERIGDELGEHESRLADRKHDELAVHDRIEELEETVESLERDEYDALLENHREANRKQFEIERLEKERREIEDERTEVVQKLDARDSLADEHERVTDELADLRRRIERIEGDAVEQFNDHMATVLDLLAYENVDRVWIERLAETTGTTFDLHVVRQTDAGEVYEDSVDHLSESEREVIGLVFALAGFLVHEAYDHVPFVLLDSLEAIDSARIATLVDYFADYATHLVVALLPEDAAALDDGYERVTEI